MICVVKHVLNVGHKFPSIPNFIQWHTWMSNYILDLYVDAMHCPELNACLAEHCE